MQDTIKVDVNGCADQWKDALCQWFDPIEIEHLGCGDFIARRLVNGAIERIGKYEMRSQSGWFVISKEMAADAAAIGELNG